MPPGVAGGVRGGAAAGETCLDAHIGTGGRLEPNPNQGGTMKRRLFICIAPLLAIAMLAVAPALAQASPQWYTNGKVVLPGEVVPVETKGVLTFKVPATKTTIKCNLADLEQIYNNAAEVGQDTMVRFYLSGCASKAPVCPTGAPAEVESLLNPSWLTKLIAGPPIRDEIANMLFVVKCGSVVIDTYSGTLFPEVGKSVLKFNAGSGTLINGGGFPVTVTGTDKLKGPPGREKITAA